MIHHKEERYTCNGCSAGLTNTIGCPFCGSTDIKTTIILIDDTGSRKKTTRKHRPLKQLDLFHEVP